MGIYLIASEEDGSFQGGACEEMGTAMIILDTFSLQYELLDITIVLTSFKNENSVFVLLEEFTAKSLSRQIAIT